MKKRDYIMKYYAIFYKDGVSSDLNIEFVRERNEEDAKVAMNILFKTIYDKDHNPSIIKIQEINENNTVNLKKACREYKEKFNKYPDVLEVEEVQEMLRIGRNAIYKLLKKGDIKSLRVGKKYIIPKTSVINFLSTALQ